MENKTLSDQKRALLKAKRVIRSITHAGQVASAKKFIDNYGKLYKDERGVITLKIILEVKESEINN